MNDGSITFSTNLDNSKLEKQLAKTQKEIEKLEQSTKSQEVQKAPLVQQAQELEQNMKAARIEVEKYGMQWREGVAGADKNQSEAIIRAQELESQHAKIVTQIDKEDKKLIPAYEKLDKMKEEAGGIAQQLATSGANTEKMNMATKKANKSMSRFALRVREVVRSALVFTLITQALAKLREWMGDVIKANNEAVKAVARLKGALLVLAQPLVNVVLPAFTAFVNVLTRAIAAIASIVSTISGSSVDESRKAAEAMQNQKDAISGVGSAAKTAAKQLAKFDDINKISANSEAVSTASSDTEIAPNFSTFDPSEYQKKISELEEIIEGALLVVGTILAFSGVNISLGITLMSLGAAAIYKELATNWGALTPKIQSAITGIITLIGMTLLIVGAIIAFSGANPPVGIAMMAEGAAFEYAAVSLNWGVLEPELQQAVSNIVMGIAFLAVAVGVLFLFTGHIALGLGLILTGAMSAWGATQLGFDWNALPPEVQTTTTAILTGIGFLSLAVGVLLLFTGHIPLGLGLITIGALACWGGTELGFDWNALPPEVQETAKTILAAVVEGAIIFGTVLLFAGQFAIGLGLLAVGALAYFGGDKIDPSWGEVSTQIGKDIKTLTKIVAGAAMVIGTILLFFGNIPLGLALIGISSATFFGLSSISSDEKLGEVKKKVTRSLDDVEQEIGSHKDSISAKSEDVGDGLTEGVEKALKAGKPRVQSAVVDTLESGIVAGNEAMDINSPSGVTEAQGNYLVDGWVLAITNGTLIMGEKTTELMNAVKNAVANAHEGIVETFKFTFNAVLSNVEVFINNYLSALRQMLQQAAKMIMALPDSPRIVIPKYTMVNVPKLATGAVIPPNREFLAVLGDQKSGNNYEVPDAKLRQLIREEAGSSGPRSLTVIMEYDKREFGRVVYDLNNQETQRVGVRLLT